MNQREGNNDTESGMERRKIKIGKLLGGTDPTGSGGTGTFQCVDHELSVGRF